MLNITNLKIFGIVVLGIMLVLLCIDYARTKTALERKNLEAQLYASQLEEQNQAIKQLKLDIETYQAKRPEIVEKVVQKYQQVKVKDTTCEAFMSALYDIQTQFFARNTPNEHLDTKGAK